jgi:hypothetical protein
MLDLAGDDARRFEDPQMFGDRRLREAGLVDQLAADAPLFFDQCPDDPDPGRVPERSGEPGQVSAEVLVTPRL